MKWDSLCLTWDDNVRRKFEEEELKPLLDQTTAVLQEVEKLSQALIAAKEQCE